MRLINGGGTGSDKSQVAGEERQIGWFIPKTEGRRLQPDEKSLSLSDMAAKSQFPDEQSNEGEFERQADVFAARTLQQLHDA